MPNSVNALPASVTARNKEGRLDFLSNWNMLFGFNNCMIRRFAFINLDVYLAKSHNLRAKICDSSNKKNFILYFQI